MNDIGVHVEPPAVAPAARDFDDAYPALFRDAYRVAFRLLGDREDAVKTHASRRARRSRRGDVMLDLEHLDALDDDAPPEPDLFGVRRRVGRMRARKRWTAVATGVVVLASTVAVVVAVRNDDHAVSVAGPSGATTEISGRLPDGLRITLTLDTPTVTLGDDIKATVVVRNDTGTTKTLGTDPIECAVHVTPVLRDSNGNVVNMYPGSSCYDLGVGLRAGSVRTFRVTIPTTSLVTPRGQPDAKYSLSVENLPGEPAWSLAPLPVTIAVPKGLTAHLELPKTTYTAGSSVEGTIVFVNGTGRPAHYYVGCTHESPWEVVLAKDGVLFEMAQGLPGCVGPPTKAALARGVTRIPFYVGLTYTDCSVLGATGPASPRCVGTRSGIPDLAPGHYQIVFRGEGAPVQSLEVEPIDITVTARP